MEYERPQTFGEEEVSIPLKCEIAVEIKPSIGDDFPTVLRKMIQQKKRGDLDVRWVLFADQFNASGVTKEQMEKMFAASDIRVVWKSDVDTIFKTASPVN